MAPARPALGYRELTRRTPPFWTPGRLVNSSYPPLTEVCDMVVGLKTEVRVGRKAEVRNPQDYKTVVEVKDEGQTSVGSRWRITKKEQNDGQKQKCKVRPLVRNFQESSELQSISPIVTKETLKLQMAIVANFGCKWTPVEGCAAFPQSKGSPRDVYVEFPSYIKELGNLWKLKEHLHGLDNVSRKF